ncbi:MAG: VWA domain-containing protein [Candidatus Eremiobacteraeota bacterium]|nr:VWA domain-containing protein [Candidatus Eremiobacteraeota bacterium]
MSVDHPARLALGLAAVALFAVVYSWLQRRSTARDLAYSNVPFFVESVKPRTWIPRALQALWVVALTGVVLGVSGPHLTLWVPARDGSVFVCIDTSGSMASTDVFPTRAQASKTAARAFIAESPPGTKIGIISFSGAAAVVASLNADHHTVAAALDDLPLPNGATAIGDALKLAAQMLPAGGHRVVILITDGVNNSGIDPMEMAQWLGAHHIPVYTIGIGTPAGGLIPGTTEEATIDEQALRGYAQSSGGAYARAENATQLRDALARLGRITSLQREPVDASLGFVVAGALAMLTAFLAGFGLGRYP